MNKAASGLPSEVQNLTHEQNRTDASGLLTKETFTCDEIQQNEVLYYKELCNILLDKLQEFHNQFDPLKIAFLEKENRDLREKLLQRNAEILNCYRSDFPIMKVT